MTVVRLFPTITQRDDGIELDGALWLHEVLADPEALTYAYVGYGDYGRVKWDAYAAPAGAAGKRLELKGLFGSIPPIDPGAVMAWGFRFDEAEWGSGPILTDSLWADWFMQEVTLYAPPLQPGAPLILPDPVFDVTQVTAGAGDLVMGGLWLEVSYVDQPVVAYTGPTGEITDTNAPRLTWTATLDPDGGAQTQYAVHVYTRATTEEAGFTPGQYHGVVARTNMGGEESWLPGAVTSWAIPIPLRNDDYVVYVRIAQTVNGQPHRSDWSSPGTFTISVAPPDSPTLAVAPQHDDGRVQLTVTASDSGPPADYMTLERSQDGEVWEPALTGEPDGRISDVTRPFVTHDWLGANGQTIYYRATAYLIFGTFRTPIGSAPAVRTGTWTSEDRWLKHPVDAAHNVKVDVWSYSTAERTARQATLTPLGRKDPIVVSDVPLAARGEITFMLEDEEQYAELEATYELHTPLLLQMTPADARPDRWIVLGNLRRVYMVDKLTVGETLVTATWQEVMP